MTLPTKTRLRKECFLLRDIQRADDRSDDRSDDRPDDREDAQEDDLRNNPPPEGVEAYLEALLSLIEKETFWRDSLALTWQERERIIREYVVEKNRHPLESLYHTMRERLGIPFSEWDLLANSRRRIDPKKLHPISLYLDDIRSPFNLGSIIRSAVSFGVSNLYLSPDTTSPSHPRVQRSSRQTPETQETLRIERIDFESVCQREKTLFALELGGTSLYEFDFPPEGCCVIGSEELGVTPAIFSQLKEENRVVSIPLVEDFLSLNVASATSILLSFWQSQLPPYKRF